jgi:hypothetical protein
LQVLLSQGHRFRALVLLGRFLDMGPWAVDLVVVGNFIVASLFPKLVVLNIMINFMTLCYVGFVCWNISICPEAVANDDARTTANSCFHLD